MQPPLPQEADRQLVKDTFNKTMNIFIIVNKIPSKKKLHLPLLDYCLI